MNAIWFYSIWGYLILKNVYLCRFTIFFTQTHVVIVPFFGIKKAIQICPLFVLFFDARTQIFMFLPLTPLVFVKIKTKYLPKPWKFAFKILFLMPLAKSMYGYDKRFWNILKWSATAMIPVITTHTNAWNCL